MEKRSPALFEFRGKRVSFALHGWWAMLPVYLLIAVIASVPALCAVVAHDEGGTSLAGAIVYCALIYGSIGISVAWSSTRTRGRRQPPGPRDQPGEPR
jgi:hypothetical protein